MPCSPLWEEGDLYIAMIDLSCMLLCYCPLMHIILEHGLVLCCENYRIGGRIDRIPRLIGIDAYGMKEAQYLLMLLLGFTL